jgi:opacity protein-like surface antigen
MKKFLAAAVFIALPSIQAQASTFDLSLNDDSVQARLSGTMVQDQNGSASLTARALYNDKKDSILGSVGMEFEGQLPQAPGFFVGFGAELSGGRLKAEPENLDIFAFSPAAKLGFQSPGLPGLSFTARVAYAPRILAFADLERMFEAGLRTSYAITPGIDLYVEYQYIRCKFEDLGSGTIDEAVRLGFMARF